MSQVIRNKYGVILASVLVSVIILSVFAYANATHVIPAPTQIKITGAPSAFIKLSSNAWKETNPIPLVQTSDGNCITTSKANVVYYWRSFNFKYADGSAVTAANLNPLYRVDGIEVIIDADQSTAGGTWKVNVGKSSATLGTEKTVTPFVATSCGATREFMLGGPGVPADPTRTMDLWLSGAITGWTPADITQLGFGVLLDIGSSTNAKKADRIQVDVYLTPDITAPKMTLTKAPAAPTGNDPWYKSKPVTVTVTAKDDLTNVTAINCFINGLAVTLSNASPLPAPTGTGEFQALLEGDNNVECFGIDSAGNDGKVIGNGPGSTPMPVLIKIDTEAPNVVGTPNRAPDFNGWYNAPFTVNWLTGSSDATSGIASCSANETYSTPDTLAGTLNGTCIDVAGNLGSGAFGPFKFDDTDPTLTLPSTYKPTFDGVSTFVTFVATTNDPSISGTAAVSCLRPSGSAFPQGTTTVKCTATDGAGNQVTRPFTISVTLVENGNVVPTGPDSGQATLTSSSGNSLACNADGTLCASVLMSSNSPITVKTATVAMRFDDTALVSSNVICFIDPVTSLNTYCEEWILDGLTVSIPPSVSGECDTDGNPLTPPQPLGSNQELACVNGIVTVTWSVSNGSTLTVQYIFEKDKPLKHLITSAPTPVPSTFITQQWPLTADELVLQGTVLGDGRTITLLGTGVAKQLGFWKNNPTETSNHLPVSLGTHGVNVFDDPTDSIGDAKAIFNAANSNDNAMDKLAADLLIAKLNEQIDVNNGCIVKAIKNADDMLAAPPVPYTGVGTKPEPADKTPVINLHNSLSAFSTAGCPDPSFTLTKIDLFGDPPTLQDSDPVLVFNNAGQAVAAENLKSAFGEFDSITVTRSGTGVTIQFRYVFDGNLDPATATRYGHSGDFTLQTAASSTLTTTNTATGRAYNQDCPTTINTTKDTTTTRIRTAFRTSTATCTDAVLLFDISPIITANAGKAVTITSATLTFSKGGTPANPYGRSLELTRMLDSLTARPDTSGATASAVWNEIRGGIVYAKVPVESLSNFALPSQAITDIQAKLASTFSATGGYFAVGLKFTGGTSGATTDQLRNVDNNTGDTITADNIVIVAGTGASGSGVPQLVVNYSCSPSCG